MENAIKETTDNPLTVEQGMGQTDNNNTSFMYTEVAVGVVVVV